MPMRGTARLDGPGRVLVSHDDVRARRSRRARVIVAVGSTSKVPEMPGLDEVPVLDEPRGDLGAGAAGEPPGPRRRPDRRGAGAGLCPLRRAGHARRAGRAILPRDHPRIIGGGGGGARSATGSRSAPGAGGGGACRRRRRTGAIGSTSTTGRAWRARPSCWRSVAACRSTGSGSRASASTSQRDASSRTGSCGSRRTSTWPATRPAPRCTPTSATTRARWRCASRSARTSRPDYRAIPRAVYTDPETGSVGLLLEEALKHGLDAEELTADLATSAKGYAAEAEGHVTHRRRPRRRHPGRRLHGRAGRQRGDPRGGAGGEAADAARPSWPTRSTPSRRWRG